ncbi:hypothetical protein HOU79_gp51 [Vibrio phage 1.224.A._10N.261.48.B1]|uniref:Uncharacterized protein n=1 Tax=Vibrio phage 1.224.A._10N.261.48.B1 TaxID=1881226 RepID=A0A2I7RRZ1_9CAUD|nr:hypothetical protein HOU79_gp51 [Vibrio phage 1.224.A._10N.261.48.B1]AUR96422.1 hypothetical protein NVP1224A_55 [Vibrio phage 1.224.A._10N.261.48.B1]
MNNQIKMTTNAVPNMLELNEAEDAVTAELQDPIPIKHATTTPSIRSNLFSMIGTPSFNLGHPNHQTRHLHHRQQGLLLVLVLDQA